VAIPRSGFVHGRKAVNFLAAVCIAAAIRYLAMTRTLVGNGLDTLKEAG
jgi:hypothetical protein